MCFSFVKNQLDRDREAYEARCQANRENGARGGRPKKPTKPNETEKSEWFSEKPKKPDNDSDNVNVTDYVKDNTFLSSNDDEERAPKYQEVISLFNSVCVSLPKVEKLTANRKQRIRSANKELNGDFESFFKKIEESDFLSGRTGSWSGCSFDWCLKPSNIIKIVEGNYSNKPQSANTGQGYYIDYGMGDD